MASSNWLFVLNLPREKRIDELASRLLSPIDFNTCDGSSIPEVQAAPVDAATRVVA